MKPKERIELYKKAIAFYKKHPTGIQPRDPLSNFHDWKRPFYGICDITGCYEKELTELHELRPLNMDYFPFFWAKSESGVFARVEVLREMIKLAKAAKK